MVIIGLYAFLYDRAVQKFHLFVFMNIVSYIMLNIHVKCFSIN